MAEEENGGSDAGHMPDDPDRRGPSTLLPMLIGGLVLITVGMAVVVIFV